MTTETPFIVMSAPNGARRGKADHPRIPLSPRELADDAQAILEQGASMLHLHVRDESDRHTLDVRRYRLAIEAIRDRIGRDLVIQVTTEACGIYTAEQQMVVVKDLKPEGVSIALRELVSARDDVCGTGRFFEWLLSNGVMPQYILYTPEEVAWFDDLRRRGVFCTDLPFVLFVLGRYGTTHHGNPDDIGDYRKALGDDRIPWAVCCFGPREDEASLQAALAGGHARVGFENNLLMPDGSEAPDNAALVQLAAGHARDARRRIASAEDVRNLFL